MGDHSDNSKGGILKRWVESNGLDLIDTGPSPTYVTTRGNSIVDHVFTNVPGVTGLTSDPVTNVAGHRPIIGTISLSARQDIPTIKYERTKLENLKDTDIRDRLNARLTLTISPFRSRLRQFMESEALQLVDSNSKQMIIDEFDEGILCTGTPKKIWVFIKWL